jgi:DNA-binding LytR/AlgR family response regulator
MIKTKVNILIASISNDFINKISALLSDEEFEIYSSISGKNAFNLANEKQPKVIICDKLLSDMNGFKFLESIQNSKSFELPIFIFYAPNATKSEIRQGMELGADDFLIDPITEIELTKLIKNQTEKRAKLLSIKNKTISELKNKLKENIQNKTGQKYSLTSLDDYIFLDDKFNPGFYAIKDFVFISSKKDYTQIFISNKKTITIHKTLSFWENFLPRNKFLRIHRQTIINLDFVKKVEKNNSYRFNIFLDGFDKPFVISQRYSKKIKTSWGVN